MFDNKHKSIWTIYIFTTFSYEVKASCPGRGFSLSSMLRRPRVRTLLQRSLSFTFSYPASTHMKGSVLPSRRCLTAGTKGSNLYNNGGDDKKSKREEGRSVFANMMTKVASMLGGAESAQIKTADQVTDAHCFASISPFPFLYSISFYIYTFSHFGLHRTIRSFIHAMDILINSEPSIFLLGLYRCSSSPLVRSRLLLEIP